MTEQSDEASKRGVELNPTANRKITIALIGGIALGVFAGKLHAHFASKMDPALLKCQVDSWVSGGPEKQEVIPAWLQGTQVVPREGAGPVTYGEHQAMAVLQLGGPEDSQTSLKMTLGPVQAALYDIDYDGQIGPLNVLSYGDTRFQCWVDRG